jgi:putative PIN family toxin of toxin-antitoxin system
MRVMCDTNVLVRPILTPSGAAAELLRRIAEEHLLVTSAYQLTELLDVLRRPAIRVLHGRTDRDLRRIISRIYSLASVVRLPADIPTIVQYDPEGNPIVMTAVAGRAEVLCTLDRHLRRPEVIDFCAGHGVRILTDSDLLAELRGR